MINISVVGYHRLKQVILSKPFFSVSSETECEEHHTRNSHEQES